MLFKRDDERLPGSGHPSSPVPRPGFETSDWTCSGGKL
jgi:hypothetical protein